MNNSVSRITLDVQMTNEMQIVYVKQGDTARIIEIALSDGGFPYTITEDCSVAFAATKPDGNTLYNTCEIIDNKIVYKLGEQDTVLAGRVLAEIKLYGKEGGILTTAHFVIHVLAASFDSTQAESSAQFSALDALIAELTKKLDSELVQGKDGVGIVSIEKGDVVGNTTYIIITLSDGSVHTFGIDAPQGQKGNDGLSAYELAVQQGYTGNLAAWLASLKGDPGQTGPAGSDGAPGAAGAPGLSAYELAVQSGYVGTLKEWLESLRGPKGDPGEGAGGAIPEDLDKIIEVTETQPTSPMNQAWVDPNSEMCEVPSWEAFKSLKDKIDAALGTGGGLGISEDFKQALHNLFVVTAYATPTGREYLDALDLAMGYSASPDDEPPIDKPETYFDYIGGCGSAEPTVTDGIVAVDRYKKVNDGGTGSSTAAYFVGYACDVQEGDTITFHISEKMASVSFNRLYILDDDNNIIVTFGSGSAINNIIWDYDNKTLYKGTYVKVSDGDTFTAPKSGRMHIDFRYGSSVVYFNDEGSPANTTTAMITQLLVYDKNVMVSKS